MPTIPRARSPLSAWWRRYGTGISLFAPFAVLFLVFVILPVVSAIGYSFSYYNMLQPPRWIGLTNYRLLFLDDDVFFIALKNTLLFVAVNGTASVFFSFMVAWMIERMRGKNLFALAFYAPSITSSIAMSIVWLYFFSNDRYGLLNNFLIELGAIGEPILWTLDAGTIMPVVMIISVWMSMGQGFLVFLAGLKNVPHELYEAARIDGVRGGLQELWYITLPCMKPQLLFSVVGAIVASFSVFEVAMSVAGMPSPNYAGHTIVAHLYDYAFIRFEMGYASAVAVVLFLLAFLLNRFFMKLLASRDLD